MIYYQGHTVHLVSTRVLLEGRLTEEQLNNFRREVGVMVSELSASLPDA